MSLRRFLNYNYNVYIASIYTLLRLRHQTRSSSPALRKIFPFTGAAIPFLTFLKIEAWSPFSKQDEADALGIKMRNKKDLGLLRDLVAADKLYDNGERQQIYDLLLKHKEKDEPEVLWRLARASYDRAMKLQKGSKEMNEAMQDAFSLVEKSLELDDQNFAAHKWMFILMNEVSLMKGLKEQIIQAENVKKHIVRATELNPKDPTSIHLLGRWCYSVAEVPYWQRKAAETFIAKPPSCEFKEAVEHFLRAEEVKPHFYSMNLLMLAKCYIRLGDLDKAFTYLTALSACKCQTSEDVDAVAEGDRLYNANKSAFNKIRDQGIASGQ